MQSSVSRDLPPTGAIHPDLLPSVVSGDVLDEGPAVAAIGVLHVINGEHYAGAERVQDLLAMRLPALGFEVGFACVKPGRFAEARQSRQSPLYVVPMRAKVDLRAAWKIARLVRRHGYQIIHGHTARSALVGRLAAALAGVPMVYHVHSPTARNTTRRGLNRVNALAERWSLTGVSRLVAVSESLARHMAQEGFDPARIVVVHNGVPKVEPLPPRTPPRGTWTLGTVALFRPRKGVEMLLEALAILKRQGLSVQLRAVGPFETPRYAAQLAISAKQFGLGGLIDWAGFRHDVTAELRHMDLLVLPSLFGEGLPMVVLEAMAAGVPVVATDVEGTPEDIRDCVDGVIVRPGDPQALADGIARIVRGQLDWSALRTSALARHAAKFSDRAMAAGVAAVYRAVLGSSNRIGCSADGRLDP